MNSQSMKKDILVSTIIPSYNKHHYLQEALFSVLQQTHEKQEVIIINDYPTLEEKEKIEALRKIDKRIKVLHNTKNLWVSITRNKWITMSAWKYIAFLDDDDIRCDTQKIAKQIWILESDKNIAAVWTQYKRINTEWEIIRPVILPISDDEIRKVINFQMPMLQSSIVVPRDAIYKAWLYNPSLKVTEDYDLVVSLWHLWKLINTQEYQTLYRINEWLTSTQWRKMPFNWLQVVLEKWHIYPKQFSSLLYRVCIVYTKNSLLKMLSREQIETLKKLRDVFLPKWTNL